MQKILSLKVELWAVLLICLLGILAMIGFGFAALDGERGAKRFGGLSRTALLLAEIPDTVKKTLTDKDRMQVYNSALFDGDPTGWFSPVGTMPSIDGYLLQSRFDGTRRRALVELISLTDWQVQHSWVIDEQSVNEGFSVQSQQTIVSNWANEFYRAIHPVLLADGQLVIKDHFSPLVSINACGKRNWIVPDKLFHHSSEPDVDGTIWVPSLIEPPSVPHVPKDFLEDELVHVAPDGSLLAQISVPQILLRHDLAHLMFTNGRYDADALHLNDIQPVAADGPYWKKGDLLLSLRNISTIMLYRPTTDQIVWMKQGPWIAQHDVDILDDHRIAVYDNRAEMRGDMTFVEDHSRIVIHDLATGQDSTILDPLMKSENIRTLFAGLYSALPGGYHLIEDVTAAKLVVADPAGRSVAEFTNRAEDGNVYQLGWSRFMTRSQGDLALSAMKGVVCDE